MKIQKQINIVRPPLKLVAPLTYYICLAFGFTNLIIGTLLFFSVSPITQQAFTIDFSQGLFGYRVWGVIYIMLGLTHLTYLFLNRWKELRNTLIFALCTKMIWTFSLIYMIVHGHNVFLTLTFWLFMAWVQAWTIVYFTPRTVIPEGMGDGK